MCSSLSVYFSAVFSNFPYLGVAFVSVFYFGVVATVNGDFSLIISSHWLLYMYDCTYILHIYRTYILIFYVNFIYRCPGEY